MRQAGFRVKCDGYSDLAGSCWEEEFKYTGTMREFTAELRAKGWHVPKHPEKDHLCPDCRKAEEGYDFNQEKKA